jgi:hypothetical protein
VPPTFAVTHPDLTPPSLRSKGNHQIGGNHNQN